MNAATFACMVGRDVLAFDLMLRIEMMFSTCQDTRRRALEDMHRETVSRELHCFIGSPKNYYTVGYANALEDMRYRIAEMLGEV